MIDEKVKEMLTSKDEEMFKLGFMLAVEQMTTREEYHELMYALTCRYSYTNKGVPLEEIRHIRKHVQQKHLSNIIGKR